MAEVIGVVSGAITFATVIAQVSNAIITIKDSWSQFRDAPDDLQYLMRDLELFRLILAEIEEDLSQKDLAFALKDSKHAMQSLQFSKEAATSLQALSEEFLRDMHCSSRLRKSYAAAKAVMQRGKLEKHLARLRNAIQWLSLSQQCYTRALIRVQPDLIAERLVQGKNNTSIFKSEACPPENAFRGETPGILIVPAERVPQGASRHTRTSKYSWSLSLPPWLCTKVLEVCSERRFNGWQWVFRAYNVIPSTSRVFSLTIEGKVEDLQNLFSMKQASPFDRTNCCGYTLLHYAVLGPKKEKVLKFLLEQGVDSSIGSTHSETETPLATLVACETPEFNRDHSISPSLRLLLRYTRQIDYEDLPEEVIGGVLTRCRGSILEFKFLQQHCIPSYYELPQETRIAVACKAVVEMLDAYHMPGLVQTILGPNTLTAQDLQKEGRWRFDSRDTTLVHCVVRKIGACQAALQGSHPWKIKSRHKTRLTEPYFYIRLKEEYLDLYESWEKLFTGFLQAGADLNHVVDRQTLLLAFLEGYLDWFDVSQCPLLFPSEALQKWLIDLENAGIDLQEFGEREDSIWKKDLVQRNFIAHDEENPSSHRIIGFSYGPSVADWSVWLSPSVDVFVGDFWRLVEKPVEMMAGGWPCE